MTEFVKCNRVVIGLIVGEMCRYDANAMVGCSQ